MSEKQTTLAGTAKPGNDSATKGSEADTLKQYRDAAEKSAADKKASSEGDSMPSDTSSDTGA